MRKVVLFVHVSLDGFCAGPKGALDWVPVDKEMENYADEIVRTVGSPLYGRVTYKMMESFWPTVLKKASASKHDIRHARWIENVEKIVFSKSLKKVAWNNTRVIRDHIPREIAKLKQQRGKDLVIFGSPTLAQTFMRLDLIDEYRLTVCPVVLGAGKPLFGDIKNHVKLKRLQSKTFDSGVVALHYRVKS